jgi:hypothetical protein
VVAVVAGIVLVAAVPGQAADKAPAEAKPAAGERAAVVAAF